MRLGSTLTLTRSLLADSAARFFVGVEKNAAPMRGIDPQWRRKGNFHFPFGVKPVWNVVVPEPKNAARNKKMHGITGI
jgi:hypothetical protein